MEGSQGSSVSIVTGYGPDDRRLWTRWPGGGKRIFSVKSVSILALGPTQPPVQWVPGVLSLGGKRGRGVTLTTHPPLVLKSRMSRSYTPSAFIGMLWDSFTFFLSCHGTFWSFHIYYHENIPTRTVLLLNRHIICIWSNRRKSVLWAETSWKYRDVMR
jgi:hypothetical protein